MALTDREEVDPTEGQTLAEAAAADPARLAALRRAAILDTDPEEDFDRLTRLASRLLRAPIALVSLVDRDRQWFKSSVGLPEPWATARQTPLTHSFCQHVVASASPLVIPDAREDSLVACNLAVPELGVVAYAGYPIRTTEGHVLGSFCVIDDRPRTWTSDELETLRDLTEAVTAEIELRAAAAEARAGQARLALVADASAILASSFDWDRTLHHTAELVVPEFADWCSFLVLEDDELRRVALATATPAMRAVAEELQAAHAVFRNPENVLLEVIREQRPVVVDVDDEVIGRASTAPEHRALYHRLGLGAIAFLPMAARGRPLGVLSVGRLPDSRPFTPDDVRLAEELARRAAVAIDNSQLFERQHRVADVLQRSLLPPHLPTIPQMDVAGRYRAGGHETAVGGDFYDLFPLEGDEWAVAIGDVCGKGTEAAALTALMRYTVRAAAMRSGTPSQTLWLLNEALVRDDDLGDRFCTACFATVRPEPGATTVTLAIGGHPLPFVVRTDGSVEAVGRPGTLLGVMDEPALVDTPVVLGPGDALVLYTDGVLEARDRTGEQFGSGRARAVLGQVAGHSADVIAGALELAVLEFQGGVARDDTAILVVRRA